MTRDLTFKVAYSCDSMQKAIDAKINAFALQLLGESFGDRMATHFPEGAIYFNFVFSHDKKPIWIVVSGEAPFVEHDPTSAHALLSEALEALKDGDQIACNCGRVDGDGNVVVPDFAGECLICRLRAATGERGFTSQ